MQIIVCSLLILSNFTARIDGKLRRSRYIQRREEPSAFQLARIQRDYDADNDVGESETNSEKQNGWLRRDDVLGDAKCVDRCNQRLNIGMDMVNAHMAFGSIDVPSVVARHDLKLFCMLDQQHTECVEECGYTVQFNLREFVCKKRFYEMSRHLACYARAAPALSRYCRPRCGGYIPLQHTFIGYSQRCRQLFCDHVCTNFILSKVCRVDEAKSAAAFLLEFTRMQLNYWLGDYARSYNISLEAAHPSSCARLRCDDFTRTCNRWRRATGDV